MRLAGLVLLIGLLGCSDDKDTPIIIVTEMDADMAEIEHDAPVDAPVDGDMDESPSVMRSLNALLEHINTTRVMTSSVYRGLFTGDGISLFDANNLILNRAASVPFVLEETLALTDTRAEVLLIDSESRRWYLWVDTDPARDYKITTTGLHLAIQHDPLIISTPQAARELIFELRRGAQPWAAADGIGGILAGITVEVIEGTTGESFTPPLTGVTNAYGHVRLTVPEGPTHWAVRATWEGKTTALFDPTFAVPTQVPFTHNILWLGPLSPDEHDPFFFDPSAVLDNEMATVVFY